MQLIDRARAVELYGRMGPAREISGGSAANTIAGLAALGARTAYVGKVKDDQLGAIFAHDLRAQGADYATPLAPARPPARDRPLHDPGQPRRRALDEHLSRRLGVPRARRHRRGRRWPRPSGSSSRATASTGPTRSPPSRRRCAPPRRAGGKVGDHALRPVLRRAPPRRVPADDPRRRRPAGRQRARAEVALPDRRPRGGDGARGGRGADHRLHRRRAAARTCWPAASGCTRPATPVRVVDATGAGDLFAAGFLHGLTTGRDWLTCARMGCLAAGEVISPHRRPARGRPARALRRRGPALSVGAPDPADVPAAPPRADNPRLGIALMILTTMVFACQDGMSRHLGAQLQRDHRGDDPLLVLRRLRARRSPRRRRAASAGSPAPRSPGCRSSAACCSRSRSA